MSLATRLQPYQPRPIRFLELWESRGWRVKVYGISSVSERPEAQLVRLAKGLARDVLPSPSTTPERYGVAFLTIHQAEPFNQITVDWWEQVNELRHHVFKAPRSAPHAFRTITATGEAFCIWEIRVIEFERRAWLETVLERAAGPDIDGYLSCRLVEDA